MSDWSMRTGIEILEGKRAELEETLGALDGGPASLADAAMAVRKTLAEIATAVAALGEIEGKRAEAPTRREGRRPREVASSPGGGEAAPRRRGRPAARVDVAPAAERTLPLGVVDVVRAEAACGLEPEAAS